VRLFVRELHKPTKPAYVPLDFAPGERAEFDFGEATVTLHGRLLKVPFLAGRLRFSGAMFVECFPTQRQEAFLLGQRHAFEFWGGVPRMAVYDNLKSAVLQVLKGHSRREHEGFLHFHSVYRFEALFANVHAGWEKGSVENLVLCRHLTPCRTFVHTKNRCFRITEGASEPCESSVSSSRTSTMCPLNS